MISDPGVVESSRWLAPEITKPPSEANSEPLTASKPAHVFALAMLVVGVFTGKVPFNCVENISAAIQISRGERPAKPQAAEQLGLTTERWKFIERCWNANPNERPTINEVVRTWEGFSNISKPFQSLFHFSDAFPLCFFTFLLFSVLFKILISYLLHRMPLAAMLDGSLRCACDEIR